MRQSRQHDVSGGASAVNADLEAGQLLLADSLNLAEDLTNSSTVWHKLMYTLVDTHTQSEPGVDCLLLSCRWSCWRPRWSSGAPS